MLDFQKPQLSDKAWIDDLLRYSDYRGSEYNFTNLFIWNSVYGQQVARAGDFLLVRACGKSGCSYFYPAGRGDAREAIELLRADAAGRTGEFRLICMTQKQTKSVELLYPGQFEDVNRNRHQITGIPVSEAVKAELERLSTETAVPMPAFA